MAPATSQSQETANVAGSFAAGAEDGSVNNPSVGPKIYSHNELLSMADDSFASGVVPLGDDKYVTSGPKKGYVYLCNARQDNAGSMVNGPWIAGSSWNFLQKLSIQGSVSWPNASFKSALSGSTRNPYEQRPSRQSHDRHVPCGLE